MIKKLYAATKHNKAKVLDRLREKDAVHFHESPTHSLNSGVHYKGKSYTTHTKLDHLDSAVYVLRRKQKLGFLILLLAFGIFIVTNPIAAIGSFIAVLSCIYFIDTMFTLYLVRKNLNFASEINVELDEIKGLNNTTLPTITILCPLYKEAKVIGDFAVNMQKLDYPQDKLEILLLLEENDTETIDAAHALNLASNVQTLIVPHSLPKTKPKACNYGLHFATGEYVVIYDAEDRPDVDQLKKAVIAFSKADKQVVCIQAKLNYFNANQNLLTRFFTAEYSLWFDVILPGFQSISTAIPLGGTSNIFKTAILKKMHGWDPFNVTEDCDLGIRLFKHNYQTALIDSVTWEEANSNVHNWIRQRSRWIKGYFQTYLVHMRSPLKLLRDKGRHWFIFQLIIGMRISFILINPILWATTISYFVFNTYVGEIIEALYPTPVYYMAVISLILGNFVYLYNYMIGLAKRGKWSLMKFVYFVPFYWLLMSFAAVKAFYQLIVSPHHWEKTHHGLVSIKVAKFKLPAWLPRINVKSQRYAFNTYLLLGGALIICLQTILLGLNIQSSYILINFGFGFVLSTTVGLATYVLFKRYGLLIESSMYATVDLAKYQLTRGRTLANKLGTYSAKGKHLLTKAKDMPKHLLSEAGFLVFAGMFTNIINFLYNTFLSRNVNIEHFGVLSIAGNFLFVMSIPLAALSRTVTFKSAFTLGRNNSIARNFWLKVRKHTFFISALIALIWALLTPVLKNYFNINDSFVFLIYIPVFIAAATGSIDGGYVNGNLKFKIYGYSIILEALTKYLFTLVFYYLGMESLIVSAVPIAVSVAAIYIYITARRIKGTVDTEELAFPQDFFRHSLFIKFSVVSFLTFDVFLAKHYLTASDAGYYALIALVGKMIYFVGSMFSQFIAPLAGKEAGEKKDSTLTLYSIIGAITLSTFLAYLGLGLFGHTFAPLLFGDKIRAISHLLPIYGLGIMAFAIASSIISFYQIRDKKEFTYAALFFACLQIFLIYKYHASIEQIVNVIAVTGVLSLVGILLLHINTLIKKKSINEDCLDILIFNWYDIKHKWGGGAELYIHEIAKRLVIEGHNVTMFVGNDKHNATFEIIDGITIHRKGGLYSVVLWAFVYYMTKFRGKYDVVLDIAKGVPFFTPLYVRKPIVGIIHHIHQEMFRTGLKFPVKHVSLFLESKIMPLVYRNTKMLTVSKSTKEAMQELGLGKKHVIELVPNGVDIQVPDIPKSDKPTVLYLGRLRFYKRVDVLIKAFEQVLHTHKDAKLYIAGSGEDEALLKKLAKDLRIANKVIFKGRVTEEEKAILYKSAWVAVQPSIVEGWGLTNLEANFCGTTVVASNTDGLKESVLHEKTGLLVEQENVDEFAKAISKIIEDNNYRNFLEKNAIEWAHKFTWDNSSKVALRLIKTKLRHGKTPLAEGGEFAYD